MRKILTLQRVKSILAATLCVLLAVESAPAAPMASAPFSFSLPSALGFVSDAFVPMGKNAQTPDVVVVQDLHVNRSVQMAISRILGRLKKQQWLPATIGVEGAAGPIEVRSMQETPSAHARQSAADYLLRQGEMPGDMHYVVTQGEGNLYGVETENVYSSIVELYRQSYEDRAGLKGDLEKLHGALTLLSKDADAQVRANAAMLSADIESLKTLVEQRVAGPEIKPALRRAALALEHLQMILPVDKARALLPPVSAAINFYMLALMRDGELFKNLMRLRASDHQTTSVLVIGGFHTPGLIDRLKKAEMSYVVITPNVRRLTRTDEKLYVERMLGHHLTPEQVAGGMDWASQLVRQPLATNLQSGLFPAALKRRAGALAAITLYLMSYLPVIAGPQKPRDGPPAQAQAEFIDDPARIPSFLKDQETARLAGDFNAAGTARWKLHYTTGGEEALRIWEDSHWQVVDQIVKRDLQIFMDPQTPSWLRNERLSEIVEFGKRGNFVNLVTQALRNQPHLSDPLLLMLKSSDPFTHRLASIALGYINDPKDISVLLGQMIEARGRGHLDRASEIAWLLHYTPGGDKALQEFEDEHPGDSTFYFDWLAEASVKSSDSAGRRIVHFQELMRYANRSKFRATVADALTSSPARSMALEDWLRLEVQNSTDPLLRQQAKEALQLMGVLPSTFMVWSLGLSAFLAIPPFFSIRLWRQKPFTMTLLAIAEITLILAGLVVGTSATMTVLAIAAVGIINITAWRVFAGRRFRGFERLVVVLGLLGLASSPLIAPPSMSAQTSQGLSTPSARDNPLAAFQALRDGGDLTDLKKRKSIIEWSWGALRSSKAAVYEFDHDPEIILALLNYLKDPLLIEDATQFVDHIIRSEDGGKAVNLAYLPRTLEAFTSAYDAQPRFSRTQSDLIIWFLRLPISHDPGVILRLKELSAAHPSAAVFLSALSLREEIAGRAQGVDRFEPSFAQSLQYRLGRAVVRAMDRDPEYSRSPAIGRLYFAVSQADNPVLVHSQFIDGIPDKDRREEMAHDIVRMLMTDVQVSVESVPFRPAFRFMRDKHLAGSSKEALSAEILSQLHRLAGDLRRLYEISDRSQGKETRFRQWRWLQQALMDISPEQQKAYRITAESKQIELIFDERQNHPIRSFMIMGMAIGVATLIVLFSFFRALGFHYERPSVRSVFLGALLLSEQLLFPTKQMPAQTISARDPEVKALNNLLDKAATLQPLTPPSAREAALHTLASHLTIGDIPDPDLKHAALVALMTDALSFDEQGQLRSGAGTSFNTVMSFAQSQDAELRKMAQALALSQLEVVEWELSQALKYGPEQYGSVDDFNRWLAQWRRLQVLYRTLDPRGADDHERTSRWRDLGAAYQSYLKWQKINHVVRKPGVILSFIVLFLAIPFAISRAWRRRSAPVPEDQTADAVRRFQRLFEGYSPTALSIIAGTGNLSSIVDFQPESANIYVPMDPAGYKRKQFRYLLTVKEHKEPISFSLTEFFRSDVPVRILFDEQILAERARQGQAGLKTYVVSVHQDRSALLTVNVGAFASGLYHSPSFIAGLGRALGRLHGVGVTHGVLIRHVTRDGVILKALDETNIMVEERFPALPHNRLFAGLLNLFVVRGWMEPIRIRFANFARGNAVLTAAQTQNEYESVVQALKDTNWDDSFGMTHQKLISLFNANYDRGLNETKEVLPPSMRPRNGFAPVAMIMLALVSSAALAVFRAILLSMQQGRDTAFHVSEKLAEAFAYAQKADLASVFTPTLVAYLLLVSLVIIVMKKFMDEKQNGRLELAYAGSIRPELTKSGLSTAPHFVPDLLSNAWVYIHDRWVQKRLQSESEPLLSSFINTAA